MMARAKVLIVEDERLIALDLNNLLTDLGYQVVGAAASGEEALKMIQEDKPDIASWDLRLSGTLDGIQAADILYSKYDIPVIFLTTFAGEVTLRRSRATEPFGFLFKPFDEKQMFVTIEVALQRHELEKKIKEGERWLNTILRSIGDGVIVNDANGQIRFVNRVAEALTGWSQDDAIGQPLNAVFQIIDEKSQQPIEIMTQQPGIWEASAEKAFEQLLVSQDGRKIPVQISAAPIQDNTGEGHGMVVAFRDISSQRQTLEEIRRQASRTEALLAVAKQVNSQLDLEHVLDTVLRETALGLRIDAAGIILYDDSNSQFRLAATYSCDNRLDKYRGQVFNTPRTFYETLIANPEPVVVIPDVRRIFLKPFDQIFRDEDIRTVGIAKLRMGETIMGTLNIVTIGQVRQFTDDELAIFIGLADQASIAITNARLFEQVRFGRERLKALSKELVTIQENERRSLARELHDQIGQILTGLQFSLETCKNLSGEALKHNLEEAQTLVKNLMGQIRELSLSLRPTMLDDLGLLPTLLWHFERYQRQTGIQVLFSHAGIDGRFSQEIETTVYRLVQEALTNIARYAGVQESEVHLSSDDKLLTLTVTDHGRGFNPEEKLTSLSTFGLAGMKERVNLLGGQLEIQSAPGVGTQIQVMLPLSQPLERRKHERNRLVS